MFDFATTTITLVGGIAGIILPAFLLFYSGYKQRPRLSILAFIPGVAIAFALWSENAPGSNDPQSFSFSFEETIIFAAVLSAIPVTIAFFAARFIGKQSGPKQRIRFGKIDLAIIGTFLVLVIATAPLLSGVSQVTKQSIPNPDLYVDLDRAVTSETFFYYAPYRDPATPADIEAAEARLGIILPQGLKDVYLTANGGGMNFLYLPNGDSLDQTLFYWHAVMGTGEIETLRDTTEITRPVDLFSVPYPWNRDPTQILAADDWVILANTVTHAMFLDYSTGPTPRLGLIEFTEAHGQDNPEYFDSFATFMAATRIHNQ